MTDSTIGGQENFWLLNGNETSRLKNLFETLIEGVSSVPSYDIFERALQACFWASFMEDEGRKTQASVVFAPPEKCVQYTRLQIPEKVTEENIRKLSQATNPDTSALAVWGGEIWGIAFMLSAAAPFVSMVGPGKLLVRKERRVYASLTANKLKIFREREIIQTIAERHGCEKDTVEFLVEMSGWIRRLRHGGAVIITPCGPKVTEARHVTEPEKIFCLSMRRQEATISDPLRAQAERHRKETEWNRMLESLARLTAIDGALILDPTRQLQCFGAKLGPSEPARCIRFMQAEDSAPSKGSLQALGGTRHQSAANYAWSVPGTLALVVSQDGGVSLMSKVNEELLVTRGIEHVLPLDSKTLQFVITASGSVTLPAFEASGEARIEVPHEHL